MCTGLREESPRELMRYKWPALFTDRRIFSRAAENEPYIEFLQTVCLGGDEEDEEDQGAKEHKESLSNDEGDEYEEVLNESEGEDESGRLRSDFLRESWNHDDNKYSTRNEKVRLFMKGMLGEEEDLAYVDQVEVVARFCEEQDSKRLDRKPVAWLDDRNSADTNPISIKKGDCRPCLGPLTAQGLLGELRKKRFRTSSEQAVSGGAFEQNESDAERRVIFITDLDPFTIEALVTTASYTQAPALKNLLYNHLMGKASLGATIPSTGFRTFTLDFNIPYYVLRQSNHVLKDSRKISDGAPLRQSWNLASLFKSTDTNKSSSTDRTYALYEAQISIVVTGIDQYVWTAYGFVDTYFGSEESVEGYHQMKGRHCPRLGRPDPLAAGRIAADEPIFRPRDYFMKVLEIRTNLVVREWSYIGDKMEEEVARSRNFKFPLSSYDPNTRQAMREFCSWSAQMIKLSRQLTSRLSDTAEAWDEFCKKDIGYFLDYDSPSSLSLKASMAAVDSGFAKMRCLLSKLQRLENELSQDNPQGLNAHLSIENSEATIFQQKSARHIQILTVVTIVYLPLALAASIFSTTGVLPFAPSLPRFAYMLLVLGFLVGATALISVDWNSWLHSSDLTAKPPKLKLPGQVRKDNDVHKAEQESEKVPETKAAWTLKIVLALKRSFLPHRYKKSDLRSSWDLERGCEEPFIGNYGLENVLESPSLPSVSAFERLPDPLSSLMGWDAPTKSKPRTSTAIKESLDSHRFQYRLSESDEDPLHPARHKRKSLDSPGFKFRLSESDEDLLHPVRYRKKRAGLQAHVGGYSGFAAQRSNIGRGDTKTKPTPTSRLQECQKFLTCILGNITVLRDAGFSSSTATYLRIDRTRTQVAFLESVKLDELAQLEGWIDETKTSLENLQRLDCACKDLLGDCLVLSTLLETGNIALMSLRLFDLFLVSHVCSHMGDLGTLMRKGTSVRRKFQISSQASSMTELSVPLETGTMSFSRRTLKCLNGFLCGEQVWVLHGPCMDPLDSTELFLSTDPDTFADVWGPMWRINSQGKPMEILRYDLDHGSVVPFRLISESGGSSVRTGLNEELCHWIPNSELEKFEKALANTAPPLIGHTRLLIGACRHSVIPNTEKCYCNLTAVNKEFIGKGYRRPIGSSPIRWATESIAMGTTIGGSGLGAPAFQYSQTIKKDGIPVREAFHKRWKNSSPRKRPWQCLLLRFGLQVSVCTRNSRRVRLVDLIAGDTMKEFMRSYPAYANEPWREAFEDILHTDPAQLINFQADNPAEREHVEQYITDCLDGLSHTGVGSRANDRLVALWIYNGQPWEIAFPRRCHSWTGFVEDRDLMCSFIVLESCLENVLGLKCCHSRENMPEEEAQRMRRDTPAVLETFLAISDQGELPNGLRLVTRTDDRLQWSVGDLWNRKHCIKLGKLGKLEGKDSPSRRTQKENARPDSERVLTGKWIPEGRIEATTRVLSGFVTNLEAHTEHIHDDGENELPLPYHISDET